jgi:hypothetical protein
MRTRVIAAMAILVALTVTLVGPTSAAEVERSSDERPLGGAERVLVFTVPTLTWADLERVDAPHLEALLADSVVGDLSPRAVTRRTGPADAYATLNAGTRAEGTEQASLAFVAGISRSSTDGDPSGVPAEAFEPEPANEALDAGPVAAPTTVPDPEAVDPALAPEAGENYDGTPAAEEFARRTGVEPRAGQVFNFGIVSMRDLNSKLLFDAEVGALGDALADGDVSRAVIANGDHGEGDDDVNFRREASVGLMDRNGLVQRGRVGRTLLEPDSAAPFGTRYDIDEVAAAFGEFWEPSSVVLVEASDMVRYEDAKPLMLPSQQERQRDAAILRSDDLLGRLLEQVDLSTDAVVVVAPYAADEGTNLTVVGVRAPALEAGLLSSGTTRRAGFVQTVDLAPSVLSLVDVDVPSSMEGTVMERAGSGGASLEDRAEFLIDADSAARFRDRTLGAASVVFVVAQLLLWGAALWTLGRPGRPARTGIEIATLAVLLYLPATFLAGALPLHEWGTAAWWAVVLGVSVVAATVVHLLTRRYLVDPLITALALIVGVLSVDLVLGGPLQFNTVFGYTPTVAGRFNGMGNPAFSMLSAAGIILSALIAHRVPGRRGVWGAVALLGWCVVLDGAPNLGADVGGALTMVPAAGVTAFMLLGWRIKVRTALIGAAVTVAVVLGFGMWDLTRPAAKQTHLGRLVADVRDNGFDAFQTVVLRKLNANLSVLTSSIWILMLPLVFAFVAFLFWKAPWRLHTIRERIPQERAALAGLITAMVLGFALNDSGISVPGIMLGVANAALINLLLRVDDDLPSSAADARRRAGAPAAEGDVATDTATETDTVAEAQVGGSQSERT